MPATAAQVRANQLNALKSTGPKTPEGKDASRANALKHGLTATVLLPEREAAEIERRYVGFCEELQPTGEVGVALARLAATMSVRMDRCVQNENARLSERSRRAEADFEAPEGADAATAAKLRAEAAQLAMFDPSPEASLARKYEAASVRSFFRALKELRTLQVENAKVQGAALVEELGSFSPAGLSDEEFNEMAIKMGLPPLPEEPARPDRGGRGGRVDLAGGVDVPFAIGKRR